MDGPVILMCRLFYEGNKSPPLPNLTPHEDPQELAREQGEEGSEARFLLKLKKRLAKMEEPDRELFVALARRLAAAKR